VEIVTGLRSVLALQFFEPDMVGEKGFDAAILEALTRAKARIVSKTSNANTITHYLACPPATAERAIADLRARFPTADVAAREVAIVSVIGSDIGAPRLVGDAMAALVRGGVQAIGMQHQMRNVDVQFIVERGDFDRAIVCLHDALVVAHDRRSASLVAA
jgi:aspartate kinase